MSFPRYPMYKDSEVEWLGEVPAHWEVKSIKWLSPVSRGASPRPIEDPRYFEDDGEYAWVRIADSTASTGLLTETAQRLSALGSSLSVKLEPGQLFVSIAGTVGKPCITAIKACIHDGFVYFPRLEINPRFLFRIFEAGVCYGGLGKMGTQLNLNTDTIGSIRIAIPPPDELARLLTFIDRETAKIDALVAEQEKLIALLQEKRQAVISHAVTKGLDPNAPMKNSGLEWLGKVPAHWEVIPLKRDIEFVTSGARGWAENYAEDGDLFLRIGNLTRDSIRLDLSDSQRVAVPDSAEVARTQVKAGDILFSITAYLGSVAVVPQGLGRAFVSQHVALVRPSKKLCLSEWSAYVAISYIGKTHLETTGYGGTKVQLSLADVTSLPMLIPPMYEQASLIEFLNGETAKLDALMAQARTAITLLQERRTALISAAVTGQIDLRGLAPMEAA